MAGKPPPISISEQDGTPTVWSPWQVKFPNGTVTDNGDGTVSVNTGGGGTGEIIEARSPLLKAGTVVSILTDGSTTNFLRGDGTLAVPAGGQVLEARSPILKAGTILSLNTDGNTANFLNGAGVFTTPSGGSSIVYAPSGATYIIQTNNSVLSNAQILASLSTGLLKNSAVTGVLLIATSGTDYEGPLTAGSPILRKGNVYYFQTDGTTTNFFRGDGTYSAMSAAIAYAPSNSTYIVQVADSVLSNEQALAALPTGLLKSTTTTGVLTIGSGGIDFENLVTAGSPVLRRTNLFYLLTDGGTTTYLRGDGTYKIPFEARTPLLAAGTVMSVLTDGGTTTYLRGDGTYKIPYEARSPLLAAGTVMTVRTDGTATNFLSGVGSYIVPVEARSPLLKAGSVMSLQTSNVAKQYLTGVGSWGPVTTMQTSATLNLTASGEFGLDTTDDAFMIYNSTTGRVYAHYIYPAYFCFAASSTTWLGETLPICSFRKDMDVTLVQLDVTVVGAQTPTLTFQLDERHFKGFGSAGEVKTAAAIVAQSTGTTITTFSNATVTAQAALFITTLTAGVVAGTANFLMGTLYYSLKQE